MSLRAQLSLVFTDEDLYNNFIIPCKENRELHGVVLRCLSAYYYNAEVRKLVEGIASASDEDVEQRQVESSQESINKIRDLIAIQSLMIDDVQNSMQDSIEQFSDILKMTNEEAKKRNLAEEDTSGFSSTGSVKATLEKVQPRGIPQSSEDSSKVTIDSDQFAMLMSEFREMKEMLIKHDRLLSHEGSSTAEVKEQPTEPIETVRQEQESVSALNEAKTDEAFEQMQETEETPQSSNFGEAKSAMADLLASL